MKALLLIGWTSADKPEGLYCGVDGVELMKLAGKAKSSGKYIRIGRVNNPSIIPLPCKPETVQDKKPETRATAPTPPAKPEVADTKTENQKS